MSLTVSQCWLDLHDWINHPDSGAHVFKRCWLEKDFDDSSLRTIKFGIPQDSLHLKTLIESAVDARGWLEMGTKEGQVGSDVYLSILGAGHSIKHSSISEMGADKTCKAFHAEEIDLPFMGDTGFGGSVAVWKVGTHDLLIVGAPFYSLHGVPHAGGILMKNMSEPLSTIGVFYAGLLVGGRLGWSMTIIDMNADGLEDLIVSCPSANDAYAGQILIFYGREELPHSKPVIAYMSHKNITRIGSDYIWRRDAQICSMENGSIRMETNRW